MVSSLNPHTRVEYLYFFKRLLPFCYSEDHFNQLMRPFLFPHPLFIVKCSILYSQWTCAMHPVSEAVRIRHLTSLSLCLFPGKLPDFIELMSFSGKVLTAVYNFLLIIVQQITTYVLGQSENSSSNNNHNHNHNRNDIR